MGTTWCLPLPRPWASLFRTANAFGSRGPNELKFPARSPRLRHWTALTYREQAKPLTRKGPFTKKESGENRAPVTREIFLHLQQASYRFNGSLWTGYSFMVFSFVWSFFPSVFHARISGHFCPLKLAMLTLKLNRQQFFLVCAHLDHRNVQNFVVKPLTCGSFFILNFEHFYAISIISKSIRTCRIVA